ncbi:uncharacterized protein H6S33_006091 [Morchella sextelata]|uniref:uncharacterized protein n=1 Tax=Morchella sextelata TaxID=1174677 RepID=UPI001D0589B6|nr:uncharacterized protein H6S33_006091 [Morchella sextelata]KAH0614205.1 hypothetical protein H6S33_006091 [Morchella sextelata]
MLSTRVITTGTLSKTLGQFATSGLLVRGTNCVLLQQHRAFSLSSKPFFNSSQRNKVAETEVKNLKEFRERSWPHPVYSEQEMKDIVIAHRKAKDWSDWVALSAVRFFRRAFDLVTGYKHDKQIALGNKNPGTTDAFHMTPDKWLARFIFLESIAGVPGMVAGMVRHLHSIRRLQRDQAWIETLLEEAYNERLHLLTFLHFRQPGWFMRMMILGGQGVFFNTFFLAYLISPRTCHRFVGYIEEEAVITYTRAIADLDNGRIPEWSNLRAPDIAIKYFNLKPDAVMKDILMVIRADEAKHREVNHTLANLQQTEDPNPYALTYGDRNKPHPTKGLEFTKPVGWERTEITVKPS